MTENNQLKKSQRTILNIHFDDILEKLPEQDWQYKGIKCRRGRFAQEYEHNNAATLQIDSLERLLAKTENDLKEFYL